MVKTITIEEGQTFDFKTSAFLPIVYRKEFGAEFFSDISKVETDTSIAFNVAYAMYKHANTEAVSLEEWLGSIEVMALVNVLPELVQMITADFKQTSSAKKKSAK